MNMMNGMMILESFRSQWEGYERQFQGFPFAVRSVPYLFATVMKEDVATLWQCGIHIIL